MAPPILKKQTVADFKPGAAWAGKPTRVRTRVRLNFIEAQRQILDKGRQIKTARGIVTAMLISVIIWAIVFRFVL